MKEDKIILGENCIYSTDSSETQLNNNIVICGGSGSGKTMSVMEPRLLETTNSSIVLSLSKRRLVKKYSRLFLKRGYQVYDLNYASPTEGNVMYDPMDFIHNDSDIAFIAEAIVKGQEKTYSNIDPYWDNAAQSLLKALISCVRINYGKANFKKVVDLLYGMKLWTENDIVTSSIDYIFDELESKNPNSYAVQCWKSFICLPIRTAGCILGTLHTSMDKIFTQDILNAMSRKEKIDFVQISKKKTILFITTSAVNPSQHCMMNIFYAQMFKELFEYAEGCRNGVLPVPVSVLCDDFAVGSRILNFPEYISIFREKGISVTLLLQSESQLVSMYGVNDAITIINNCDSYVYMGGMDIRTAESVSKRLNLPLDEILYLPLGKVVVIRRGERPVITCRYKVTENELYQKITLEDQLRGEGDSNKLKIYQSVYKVGDVVEHPKFGAGEIMHVSNKGDYTKLTIHFKTGKKYIDERWVQENCLYAG